MISYSPFAHATSSIYCSNDTAGIGFEVQYGSTRDYAGSKYHTPENGGSYYYVYRKWGKLDLDARIIYLVGNTGDRIENTTSMLAEDSSLGDIVFVADHSKGVVSVGGLQYQLECDWSARPVMIKHNRFLLDVFASVENKSDYEKTFWNK